MSADQSPAWPVGPLAHPGIQLGADPVPTPSSPHQITQPDAVYESFHSRSAGHPLNSIYRIPSTLVPDASD
jgi:hypothetical protein